MNGSTTIRVLMLKGGERLPVLLDRAKQQPLFDPLVYAVSRLRGRAANTVQQHLVGLQVLLDYCSLRRIDLVRQCRLSIRRRPDNPKDPRRRQPVAKTEERILEIAPELSANLSSYILGSRQTLPAARKHGFLFIDTRKGAPLSASGLDKVFTRLRTVDGLPADLTSHVLRHDWNDRFSALMDTKGVKPGDEQRLRMYLQGWTWTGSAQRYNRRHIVKRSNEALLIMQRRVVREASANER